MKYIRKVTFPNYIPFSIEIEKKVFDYYSGRVENKVQYLFLEVGEKVVNWYSGRVEYRVRHLLLEVWKKVVKRYSIRLEYRSISYSGRSREEGCLLVF